MTLTPAELSGLADIAVVAAREAGGMIAASRPTNPASWAKSV